LLLIIILIISIYFAKLKFYKNYNINWVKLILLLFKIKKII
jgi:hypothetical protein